MNRTDDKCAKTSGMAKLIMGHIGKPMIDRALLPIKNREIAQRGEQQSQGETFRNKVPTEIN
jgi:hypothetical protein